MARHPTMRTADGRWTVEVITGRTGRQTFRVKDDHTVTPPGSGWTNAGTLCGSIDEVRDLLGPSFATLAEVRNTPR